MKAISKYSAVAMVCILLASSAYGQEERTKEFNDSWDGIARINVKHRHGTLEIIPHAQNDVRLDVQIMVRAKDAKDADIMIEHLEVKSNKFSDELEIETDFNTKSWTSSGNTTKVKFDDGNKVSGILDYDVKYKLYVPSLARLELSNRYYDIEIMEDITVDELYIKQYDANVRTRAVNGEFFLSAKYSDVRVGEIGDAKLDLYDSEAEIDKTGDTYIESKYSEIKIGNASSLEVDSYDDEYEITRIDGELTIDDKYSEFEIEYAGSAKVFIYDGKLQLAQVSDYSGKSKYSDINIIDVVSIDLERSYDDNFKLRNLGSLTCYESKYSDYEIGTLSNSFHLNSYDDEVEIGDVSKGFEKLDLDCKHTTLSIPLDKIAGYTLDANSKYGSLKYPDPSDSQILKVDNDILEVKAQIGSTSKATVSIKAYDSQIKLY